MNVGMMGKLIADGAARTESGKESYASRAVARDGSSAANAADKLNLPEKRGASNSPPSE
jgi:hypothetical protein